MSSVPPGEPAEGDQPVEPTPLAGFRSRGLRPGQLLSLMGLTGFAISQPLLALAGENPTVFTFANLSGSDLVVFSLAIALVPPLVLWLATVGIGSLSQRAGDSFFAGTAVLLTGLAAVQWSKALGLEATVAVAVAATLVAIAFGVALTRVPAVAEWTRYTAILPVLSVFLLLFTSPSSQLLAGPAEISDPTNQAGPQPDVVMVMLDELPLESMLDADGQIDEVRFPHLARLAGDATWYRNYTSMAGYTVAAVPSALTGTRPSPLPPLWTSHPGNLFSLLAPTHELEVSESLTRLCGFTTCGIEGGGSSGQEREGLAPVMGQMFDAWRERVNPRPGRGPDLGQFNEEAVPLDSSKTVSSDESVWEESAVNARPGRVTDFLDALRPSPTPSLYYLHLMLPHEPWTYYPDGQRFSGYNTFEIKMPSKDPDPWVMAQLQQAHLLQATYADRMVGEIIDRLRANDMYDDSMVIVTADHGVGFETFPRLRLASDDTLDDLAFVPLLVKEPGQDRGRVDKSNLMAIDLVPTIADLLGLTVDWKVDGYPVGSKAIATRGDEKEFVSFDDLENIKTLRFSTASHQPAAQDRRVGPLEADAGPITALMEVIDAGRYLGEDPSTLKTVGRSGARIENLASLLDPPTDGPVVGRVQGVVDDRSAGDLVLIADDGAIVTAAPVADDGTFSTMMPPGVQEAGQPNRITMVQVGLDGATTLDLR
ncbi:MAG: sulfatase-like hydrolase/transferase [Microthrixaceae bacterium]|nr:sulfatase-like hydrolase/transferase [Acidimicrobiales bacterium]MCB9403623.1 sulfatase-like hydrolase/transferase [Microthrixaceae bacterium]